MAITLIVGLPGDGKSYSAVQLCILPAIQAGRPVFTNIPIKIDKIREDFSIPDDQYIRYIPADDITPDLWAGIPGGALVVVDEVWRYWPEKEKPSHQSELFFAEHRHKVGKVGDKNLSQDIVILTQDTNDIAAFIKRRVAETYIVSKLATVGMANRFSLKRFRGAVSRARQLRSNFIAESFGQYVPKVYSYYESHTRKDETTAVDLSVTEPGATKQKTVFHSFKMRFYMVAALGVLAYFAYLGSSDEPLFSFLAVPETVNQPQPSEIKPLESAPAPAPVPVPVSPPAPAPAPQAVASVNPERAPPPSPAPAPGYLNADVATRFWIAGSVRLASPKPGEPENVSLILTDGGVHTIVVQIPASNCEQRGVLFCLVDGVRFSDVPVNRSTINRAMAANSVNQQ